MDQQHREQCKYRHGAAQAWTVTKYAVALGYRAGNSKARASSSDGQLPGKAATACGADGEHDGRAGAHERAVD